MTNLFKKAAVFGDIHFGHKNNNRQFNVDCEQYIDWFITEAKKEQVDAVIFLGDWHHQRRTINVSTLNYSLSNLEKLNANFENIYFIIGNHDLYFREKRELNSIEFIRNMENITLINDITTVGNCTFIPWLVEEEWKTLNNITSKYVFGHLELPKFKMNAMVEMPDKGELRIDSFKDATLVFSGHFHKRQNKSNIWYIGNAFPHDFSDAWDDDRGFMILEWGKEPEFRTWPGQPRYRTINLSLLVEEPEKYMNDKTYIRVTTDVDLTYEEVNFLKETFTSQFCCREFQFTSKHKYNDEMEFDSDTEFQSIDQIVIEGLNSISEASSVKSEKLIEIYNLLDEKSK